MKDTDSMVKFSITFMVYLVLWLYAIKWLHHDFQLISFVDEFYSILRLRTACLEHPIVVNH